jgi:glucan phosphoethanolaminetransferase (alkaline phosphatase superfamily)
MDLYLLTGRNNTSEFFKKIGDTDDLDKKITFKQIATMIAHLIIMFIAGSLSWNCSTKHPIFLRVLFSFFASLFGLSYIILYTIFRSDMCKVKL